MTTATETFAKMDIVQIGPGTQRKHQFIIVDHKPSRHVYPYVGIKVGGNGAPYKLSPRDSMRKIGTAPETHPAYQGYISRGNSRGPQVDATYKKLVQKLIDAVKSRDLMRAETIANGLLELDED